MALYTTNRFPNLDANRVEKLFRESAPDVTDGTDVVKEAPDVTEGKEVIKEAPDVTEGKEVIKEAPDVTEGKTVDSLLEALMMS